jgi:tripartite-type tricarboxylate transporter receptor subunit TctC
MLSREVWAERMRITLNQAVVIENVTGAGGAVGVSRVASATPDGYTLSIGQNGCHVANGATYALQFDLLTTSSQSPYFQPLQCCCW